MGLMQQALSEFVDNINEEWKYFILVKTGGSSEDSFLIVARGARNDSAKGYRYKFTEDGLYGNYCWGIEDKNKKLLFVNSANGWKVGAPGDLLTILNPIKIEVYG